MKQGLLTTLHFLLFWVITGVYAYALFSTNADTAAVAKLIGLGAVAYLVSKMYRKAAHD